MDGARPVITGVTVNETPLLAWPPTVTTTGPEVAPGGTEAVMLVSLQLEIVVAWVPLNATVLEPCVLPKFAPAITTDEPIPAALGVSVLITGNTVKFTLLLACPFTVTTTGPVVAPDGTVAVMLVALQFVVLAEVPLNVTVLVDFVAPKLLPAIVTEEFTAPAVGVMLLMEGGGTGSWTVICESVLPFSVPSTLRPPLKLFEPEVCVRSMPTQR